MGPRGNYVHVGRGGIYYRKYFSDTISQHRGGVSPSFVRTQVPELGTPVVSADAAQLHDETSEGLLHEIQEKERKTRLSPIAAVLACILVFLMLSANVPFWLTFAVIPILAFVHGYLTRRDYGSKIVVLNYELDSDASARYVNLLQALQSLASTAQIWRVTSLQDFVDRKYNAGAHTLLQRKPALLRLTAPPYVRTRLAVWSLGLGDQSLYFFPDRILIYQGSNVGAVNYTDLRVELKQARFVENGNVPSDTQIIDRTWQYVNKSGGPDRRFSTNRQLPVVLYAEIALRSDAGLNVLLQASDPTKATRFNNGLLSYISPTRITTAH